MTKNPMNENDPQRALITTPQQESLGSYVLPPKNEEEGDLIDLREYWYVILKRRWTILTFFGIVVVGVLVGTFLQTPLYRGTALVQIETESSKVMDYKDVNPEEKAGGKDFYVTQYELLKSNTLAERVIDDLHLDLKDVGEDEGLISWFTGLFKGAESQAEKEKRHLIKAEQARIKKVKFFLKALTIEPVRNSRLVKIHFNSPDPNLSARVANLLAEDFITINMEKKYQANA
jgi:succinoglycan biosynthesis transport protein ExoP